jgi:hypothetical protein
MFDMKTYSLCIVVVFGLLACRSGASNGAPAPLPLTGTVVSSSTYGPDQLGHFIGGATKAERWHAAAGEVASPSPGLLETLDAARVTALLATLDLKQLPNGPLARCPGKERYVFFDAHGNKLGSITFNGCGPRFDSADGKVRGGINANF